MSHPLDYEYNGRAMYMRNVMVVSGSVGTGRPRICDDKARVEKMVSRFRLATSLKRTAWAYEF